MGLFQSLFYWISYRRDYRFADRIVELSFNPCSIGLAIEGFDRRIKVGKYARFNPCSIGLAIEGAMEKRATQRNVSLNK